MEQRDTQIIMENIDNNGELKTLWDEHVDFKRQLEKINRNRF